MMETGNKSSWWYEPSRRCKGLFDVYYKVGLYAIVGEKLAKHFCGIKISA